MTWFSQMNGSYVFITYSVSIFEQSGTNMSSDASSIILAVVQIAGTFLAARFVDRLGRKPLMAFSLFGCTFGLTAMGVYVYLDECGVDVKMFDWIPVTSLAFVILISSSGITPLIMMYIVEILPAKVSVSFYYWSFVVLLQKKIFQNQNKLYSKVRAFGLTVASATINIFSFFTVKYFPMLIDVISMYGCMSIFAINCAVGAVFIIFCTEETMGKNLNAIDDGEDDVKSIEGVTVERKS